MYQSRESIESVIDERFAAGNDNSFFILDIEDVKAKYRKMVELMPRITPFYAVKCNNDPRVIKTFVDFGIGFDCTSMNEIAQILDAGVDPKRIIFASTAKQMSHLKFAADNHVLKVTVDSPAEVIKIKKIHPNAEVLIRIRYDADSAFLCLGHKYGCDPHTEAPKLIAQCKELNLNLVGVSFHIGSGTTDFECYGKAIACCRKIFDVAESLGVKMNLLDIGGGFMGYEMSMLEPYAESINNSIAENFSDPSITIISEPGRYFLTSAAVLVAQVSLKNTKANGHIHYFINDGIFTSFLPHWINEELVDFEVIPKSKPSGKKFISTIWGITCNSKDKVVTDRLLPEFEIGDWLLFRNMGAYATSCATKFNGFESGDVLDRDPTSKVAKTPKTKC